MKRNHRLNVKHVLNIVTRSETEIGVVLKRQADQIGHRVLSRFGEFQTLNEQIKTLGQLRALVPPGQTDLAAEVDRRIVEAEDQLARLNYTFDRKFIFRVLAMGHSQFAEYIGARGPNTHVNAACATTTHAMAVAEDWIRTGRCERVIIVGGEASTSETQSPWIASGFLALGAASIKNVVSEAAKPFDADRNGTILGAGAVSLIVEREDRVRDRGLNGQAEILGTYIGNSAYHATQIDLGHLTEEMAGFVRRVENRHGLQRDHYTRSMVFMSHETFTPARGGSASAEVASLKKTFPDNFRFEKK